ncbi:hypothetical protein O6H91_09G091800 [Diphasiastrum complanatum]|uniref:Uncharacterized protein n=1 Tax=Diphasiastrum complanatum TaxID=34168 RepID=A0ACC2CRW4_DIPCM|nr:hypothetical protein O6H91_Y173700 [Diphasiastrum complanatum]KAJ7544756.1 hypothetical protein O6H91_09G091800 [Diphasiastrum complanatum]
MAGFISHILREETPLLHVAPELAGKGTGTASVQKTFGNIVIVTLGTGVLGLPFTFRVSGWAIGSISIVLSGALSYYCMMLLVKCRDKLLSKGYGNVLTYGDLGYYAYGEVGRQSVDIVMIISQCSCCVAYLIFIGHNLASIFSGPPSLYSLFICGLIPFEILLAFVRSLAALAPFSIFADVCNLLAMAIVIKDDFHVMKDFNKVKAFTGWNSMPFALGVALYCFEGFGMTLPLEASLKEPQKFGQVLGLAFASITILYLGFGFSGYLAFGETTLDIITLNLPNDWSIIAVKVGLCVALFFTFPVMMHPVYEIFERKLMISGWFQKNVIPSPMRNTLVLNGLRSMLILITVFLAVCIPGFGAFISLVGGTVCAMLAFVFPATFHLTIFRGSISSWQATVDLSLIMFGALFTLYSTSIAFLDAYSAYKS